MSRKVNFQEWLELHDACTPARRWVGSMGLTEAWDTCQNTSWKTWLIDACAGWLGTPELMMYQPNQKIIRSAILRVSRKLTRDMRPDLAEWTAKYVERCAALKRGAENEARDCALELSAKVGTIAGSDRLFGLYNLPKVLTAVSRPSHFIAYYVSLNEPPGAPVRNRVTLYGLFSAKVVLKMAEALDLKRGGSGGTFRLRDGEV